MQNTKYYYVIALNFILWIKKYGSQGDEYHVGCLTCSFLIQGRKKPQLVSMKAFSTWIEVEKFCSLSGFIDMKSTHELAPSMLMAKFQQPLWEPKSGSMWASKEAAQHTAVCLRNKSPCVEALWPCGHHLKPQNRYKLSHDKRTIVDNFQINEGKIMGKMMLKIYIWVSG